MPRPPLRQVDPAEFADAEIETISRTRRAALVAEFEWDLKIDHRKRAEALRAKRRWIRIKTTIVWGVALIFMFIAWLKIYQLSEQDTRPFESPLATVREWLPEVPQ